jgi:hypothetical protein
MAALVAAAPALAQHDWRQHDLTRPRPEVVTPSEQVLPAPVPADAVVLFGGGDLTAWESVNGGPAPWTVDGDTFVVAPGTGGIQTTQGFGDVQLHVEWSAPDEIVGTSQGRGNSGVFLMGAYEVQVLDSFENESYADGQAAAIYGQFPPLANAMRPPAEWQAYDIFFRRPRFGPSGALLEPARLTVLHNGILVQNNEELWGRTDWLQASPYVSHPDALPIMLQDHGNPVAFRNIWVRPLPERPAPAETALVVAVEMAPEEMDRFVGVYELWPGNATTVRRAGDKLRVSVLGPELELTPVGAERFAFDRTDATLTFETDPEGRATALVMGLGGVDYPAARVPPAAE